jgi:restriction system protein
LVVIYVVVPVSDLMRDRADDYKRQHPSSNVLRYMEALRRHWQHRVAVHEAEQAALRQKWSYWAELSGYEFERATAEVLKCHQFSPRVTGGSADGGIDIEVVRAGRKGVVQCKAHASGVGPHTVRDLYGVIHHSGVDFGIIISRGGFTKGAIDFARDKPIFLLSTRDLIAMQEGRDVLGRAFNRA